MPRDYFRKTRCSLETAIESSVMDARARVLIEQYRCSEAFLPLAVQDHLSDDTGFFQFGPEVICYGKSSTGYRTPEVEPALYDVSKDVTVSRSEVWLPFDPTQTISNLRLERYSDSQESQFQSHCSRVYYFLLPVIHPS